MINLYEILKYFSITNIYDWELLDTLEGMEWLYTKNINLTMKLIDSDSDDECNDEPWLRPLPGTTKRSLIELYYNKQLISMMRIVRRVNRYYLECVNLQSGLPDPIHRHGVDIVNLNYDNATIEVQMDREYYDKFISNR